MSDRIKKICWRYQREMLVAMVLFLLVTYFSKHFSKQIDDAAPLILLAMAPIAPLVLASLAFFRYFNNTDERERRIMADGAAITLLIAIIGAIFIGTLESFGAFTMNMNWFGAFLIIFWSIATVVVRRQR